MSVFDHMVRLCSIVVTCACIGYLGTLLELGYGGGIVVGMALMYGIRYLCDDLDDIERPGSEE